MNRFSILYVLVIGLNACLKNVERNPLLIGRWQCIEWTVEDAKTPYMPSFWTMDAKQVQFEFRKDGTCTTSLGTKREDGIWHTENDKLFIQETGKQETVIKMTRTDVNNLKFEINPDVKKETMKLTKTEHVRDF